MIEFLDKGTILAVYNAGIDTKRMARLHRGDLSEVSLSTLAADVDISLDEYYTECVRDGHGPEVHRQHKHVAGEESEDEEGGNDESSDESGDENHDQEWKCDDFVHAVTKNMYQTIEGTMSHNHKKILRLTLTLTLRYNES